MGDISEKGDTVTELSADLIEKAEKELGEKQQWRQRDIEALRDIIKKDQGLIWNTVLIDIIGLSYAFVVFVTAQKPAGKMRGY